MDQFSTAQGVPLQLILPAGFFFVMLVLAGIRLRLNKNAKEARRDAEALREQLAGNTSQESSLRVRAVAEAIRRDPSLEAANSSEALNRLAAATAPIMEEMRLKADLERAQQDRSREEQATHAELQRQKAAEVQEAARRAREERLAAMPPLKRLVYRYPVPSAVVASLLGLGALMGVSSALNQWNERQTEARAVEASEALKASCDPTRADEIADPVTLVAWLECESPAARIGAVRQLGYDAIDERSMEQLAKDPDEGVRAALAARNDLGLSQQLMLAADSSVEVQLALAANDQIDQEIFVKLTESANQSVLEAVRDNEDVDYLTQLMAITKLPSACVSANTDPNVSLAATRWRYDYGDGSAVDYYFRADCWEDVGYIDADGIVTRWLNGSSQEVRWRQDGDLLTISYFDNSGDAQKETYRLVKGKLVEQGNDKSDPPSVLTPAGDKPFWSE